MLFAQVIILMLMGWPLIEAADKHGEPKVAKGEHNFLYTLIGFAIVFTLYYFAGAFSLIF
jgi:hypothetical protein